MRPYYEKSGITIFLGDCREILPAIGQVDAIVTDPPYGVNKAEWDRYIGDETISNLIGCCRGYAVFCYAITGISDLLQAIAHTGRDSWIVAWGKNNAMQISRRFLPQWSPIVVAYHGSLPFWGKDFVNIPVVPQKGIDHPTVKPLKLMQWLVNKAAKSGELILDPFMGSGTTLRAAKDAGCKAIGIEIEERYCEIAARRLEQEVFAWGEG